MPMHQLSVLNNVGNIEQAIAYSPGVLEEDITTLFCFVFYLLTDTDMLWGVLHKLLFNLRYMITRLAFVMH